MPNDLLIRKDEPTAIFGRITDSYGKGDMDDVRHIVLHEFGHIIGLNHEHHNPTNTIPWNRDLLYKDMSEQNSWTREQVDQTYFTPWNPEIYPIKKTFDPDSVMMYPIENRHTVGDFEVGYNYDLSEGDIAFAKLLYPKSKDDN